MALCSPDLLRRPHERIPIVRIHLEAEGEDPIVCLHEYQAGAGGLALTELAAWRTGPRIFGSNAL